MAKTVADQMRAETLAYPGPVLIDTVVNRMELAMPPKVTEGSSLVVRASDGSRYVELRFRVKSKPLDKTPVPVSR